MPNWKKVITSGSNAQLNQITASAFQFVGSGNAELEVQGHITASGNISASSTTGVHALGGTTTVTNISASNDSFIKNNKMDILNNPAGQTYASAGNGMGDVVYTGNTSTDAGKVYYYQTNNTWALSDATDDSAGADELLAVALGGNSTTNGMLLRGVVRMSGAPAGADHDGRAVYMSETAGAVTTTAPSSAGNIIRVCGYLIQNNSKQIWFNPSSTWVEHS